MKRYNTDLWTRDQQYWFVPSSNFQVVVNARQTAADAAEKDPD